MSQSETKTYTISKEEYLKLVRALDQLMDLLDNHTLVTVSVIEKATIIYNNAEIRTFREDKP